jgi:hypothetical protein
MNCRVLLSAFRFLPSAYCRLRLRGVRVGGSLCTHISMGQDVFSTGKEETVVASKMKERSGDVFENKGSLWETWGRSANIFENKGA